MLITTTNKPIYADSYPIPASICTVKQTFNCITIRTVMHDHLNHVSLYRDELSTDLHLTVQNN